MRGSPCIATRDDVPVATAECCELECINICVRQRQPKVSSAWIVATTGAALADIRCGELERIHQCL